MHAVFRKIAHLRSTNADAVRKTPRCLLCSVLAQQLGVLKYVRRLSGGAAKILPRQGKPPLDCRSHSGIVALASRRKHIGGAGKTSCKIVPLHQK